MRKRNKVLFGIAGCLFLTACAKEVDGAEKINDILKQQPYVDVQLGEEYHQSEVKFSTEEDKAVVPKGAEWGRAEYREKKKPGYIMEKGKVEKSLRQIRKSHRSFIWMLILSLFRI